MSWHRVTPDETLGIDWSDAATCAQFDPYLQWALLTGFDGYASDPEGRVPIAVERLEGDDGEALLSLCREGRLLVPPAYLSEGKLARYFTARIHKHDLPLLGGLVRRMELGLTALHGRDEPLAPFTRLDPESPPEPRERRTLIGIIDDGCAFAHRSFRSEDGASTRVRWLWSQDRDAASGREVWSTPALFGYGAEASGERLSALLVPDPGMSEADEAAVYARAAMPDLGAGQASHGTHVMDLAAGWPDPLQRALGTVRDRDAAACADIAFVQLPVRAMEDVSGAWLCVYVLDAVRYVLSKAGPNDAVLVNISVGAFAGPHDGSSLLESALDDLLAQRPRDFAVVIAAGNARAARVHASVDLGAADSGATLRWKVPPFDHTETFVEVWVAARPGTTEAPCVHVTLIPPGRPDAAQSVAPGEACTWSDAGARSPSCLVMNSPAPAEGSRSRLVLIAIAPSAARSPGSPAAPSGVWTLRLHNSGAAARVDAYIERDDPPLGGPVRQTVFVGEDGDRSSRITTRDTLSSLATGANTFVVGACRLDDPSELLPFSAEGPTRDASKRSGPDFVAPGAQTSTQGLAAAGARSIGPTVRRAGTSMAAPVATRRIANVLSARSGMERRAILSAFFPKASAMPSDLDRRIGHGPLPLA
jgi:hypothetical protein